jgi:hypothetical protein
VWRLHLLGKEPGHLMTVVVAAVVHCGRAFSGDTIMSVVGDVGGGRDGPPRPFGCRAVMITHARATCRFGVVGSAHQWQMRQPAVNARGASARFGKRSSPGSINRRRGWGESLTTTLSIRCFLLLAFVSRLLAPLLSPTACFIFARRRQPQWPRPSQSWCWTHYCGAVRR